MLSSYVGINVLLTAYRLCSNSDKSWMNLLRMD